MAYSTLYRLPELRSTFFLSLIWLTFLVTTTNSFFHYDYQRLAELALISPVVCQSILASNRTNTLFFFHFLPHFRVTIFLILLLGLISSSIATVNKQALLELSLILVLMLFGFQVSRFVSRDAQTASLINIVFTLFAALAYQVNFFTGFVASFLENIPLVWPEPFSSFSNVRFFNQYQMWSLALLPLPLLLYPDLDRRLRFAIYALACGWSVLLFATGSRGAVVAIVLALLLSWAVFRKHAIPLLKLTSQCLLTGACVYLLLFKLLPELSQNQVTVGWVPVEELTHSNTRLELWRHALRYIYENPWLGIGPMHYAYYPGPTHAHPHNSLLQWASELGIPSTLLVIYLIASGLYAWVKKFHRLTQSGRLYVSPHLWVALFTAMCSGLIYSLVSGVIVMPLSQLMLALTTGWMLGIYFYDTAPKPVRGYQLLAYKTLAAAALITLIYTVMPGLLPRLNNEYMRLAQLDYAMIAPRFWQLGGIPHD